MPSSDIKMPIMITIYDKSGKLLYSQKIDELLSDESFEIDLSSFSYGIYILQLNNSKTIKIEKIIKR
jgi:hypothetical protein